WWRSLPPPSRRSCSWPDNRCYLRFSAVLVTPLALLASLGVPRNDLDRIAIKARRRPADGTKRPGTRYADGLLLSGRTPISRPARSAGLFLLSIASAGRIVGSGRSPRGV